MNYQELQEIISSEDIGERGVWVRLNDTYYHITSFEREHALDGDGVWLNATEEESCPDLPQYREHGTKKI